MRLTRAQPALVYLAEDEPKFFKSFNRMSTCECVLLTHLLHSHGQNNCAAGGSLTISETDESKGLFL